jgi:hypothetical protein
MSILEEIQDLKVQADQILLKYPQILELTKPYDTLQKIITLYYVAEYKYYPDIENNEYPHNIPKWKKSHIIQELNQWVAKKTSEGWVSWALSSVTGAPTVETYLQKEDIDQLYKLFKKFIKKVKHFADQAKHSK